MSDDLAVIERQPPQMTVLSNEQLRYIASTEFVPQGLRGNLPAILACVATGRALGLPDMTALRSIHVIDGKATFSAELMNQLVRRAGHSIQGEISEGAATVTGVRVDNGDEMTVTWTLEMAERAGLLGKANWKKYPESMLFARAVSQLCRALFPDCFAGATYTPEELDGDEVAVDHGGESVAPDVPQPLASGSPVDDKTLSEGEPLPADDRLTAAQHKLIEALIAKLALDRSAVKAACGVEHMTDLSKSAASVLIEQLKQTEATDDESDVPF